MNISGKRTDTDSPCVGVCSATALGDEICIGCKRTREEVENWKYYTDEQKRNINHRLNNKREL